MKNETLYTCKVVVGMVRNREERSILWTKKQQNRSIKSLDRKGDWLKSCSGDARCKWIMTSTYIRSSLLFADPGPYRNFNHPKIGWLIKIFSDFVWPLEWSTPLSSKLGKNPRRPAWLNRELLVTLKCKKWILQRVEVRPGNLGGIQRHCFSTRRYSWERQDPSVI